MTMPTEAVKQVLFDFRAEPAAGASLIDLTAAHVRNLILSGRLESGARIPCVRELAGKWPVGYVVIQRALARCAEENLLTRRPGRGTFVARRRRPRLKADCIYLAIQQTEQEAAETNYAASNYFLGFINGFQKELAAHNVLLMVMTVAGAFQEKMFLARLRANPADMVMFMRSKNTPILNELSKLDVPLLLVDPHVYSNRGFSILSHDEEHAAADIINFFVAHGRCKIGLLFLDDDKWISAQRLKSILGVIRARGLSFNSAWIKIIKRSARDKAVPQALAEMFAAPITPDALIISGLDNGAIAEAGQAAGLSIPKNPMTAIYTASADPSVAALAVVIDGYTYGRAAGRLVYNNFYHNKETSIPRNILLPFPVKDMIQQGNNKET